MPELSLAKRSEAVEREARKNLDWIIEIPGFMTLETESQQLVEALQAALVERTTERATAGD